jgi:hypothetical protein
VNILYVGCAGHGGTALGARRDRRVTVAAAEPRSFAQWRGACARGHGVQPKPPEHELRCVRRDTRDLGAMLGGAGSARGGDGGGICAGSERNADMGGGVRDVARALLRAHGRRGVPDPVLL